jgi:hypothetical protein
MKKLPLFILILVLVKCQVEDFREVVIPKITSLEVAPGSSGSLVTINGKFSQGRTPVNKITVYIKGNTGTYGPPPDGMFPYQVNSITGNTFTLSIYPEVNGTCLVFYLEANDVGYFSRTYVCYPGQNKLAGPI